MSGAELLSLQRIDTALTQIVNRRPRLPELASAKTARAAVAAAESEIEAQQRRVANAEATIADIEHRSEQLTVKRNRLEAQLKTVIASREAEALMHEIATINSHRSDLDDEELAALDDDAEAGVLIAQVHLSLDTLRQQQAEADAALAEVTAQLNAEQASLNADRIAAAAALGADDLANYDRLRQRFQGVAVAELNGTRCEGCHLDLSRAEVDELRGLPAGELGDCPQCGRLLVISGH